MESLLSPAFDRISSKDPSRIGRGLRQVEGLLAQICLSQQQQQQQQSQPQTPSKRKSSSASQRAANRSLDGLGADPVFVEFYRLQESFQWNVPSRLIECLERLLGMGSSTETDKLIVSNLSILHGTLLLHPPSRTLFARQGYMNMILDLLDPTNESVIVTTALVVLVVALLDCPRCARTFEAADGLHTVSSLFRSKAAGQHVKMRVLDFINFYLMPEEPPSRPSTSASDVSVISDASRLQSSPGKYTTGTVKTMLSNSSDGDSTLRRSSAEKRRMLGEYMHNVEQLANDLSRIAPFAIPGF